MRRKNFGTDGVRRNSLQTYSETCIYCVPAVFCDAMQELGHHAHSGAKVGDQLYVKHTFPKISGAQSASRDNNYGMLYHEPTTEAEIEMNELWLAKRQQEVCQDL